MKRSKIVLFGSLALLWSCENFDQGVSPNSYDYDYPAEAGDEYAEYEENPFLNVADQPISTFSIDADGASYANIRRYVLSQNVRPPSAAIRTEELINYFDLDYEYTDPTHPIALNGEVASCPWNAENKLLRIGIKGKAIPNHELPNSNFVFLIDVSGSMGSEDKLELLKSGFQLFVDQMRTEDRIAIVTYAGSAGVALPSTAGTDKETIKDAIRRLGSGGSTAGAAGITKAYEIAEEHFIDGGNNRVILGTDGDFNVGISSQDELVKLIEEKRESGVFFTVLGVGRGNLKDSRMEQLANNGNGNYEYIDDIAQLRKVFIHDYRKFYTVAKDVKIQVEFNPRNVVSYRLIGYENRLLNTEDFEDDEEDAGEIGSGQNITALYEIVPNPDLSARSEPSITIDFRYKQPDSDVSELIDLILRDGETSFDNSSDYMKFTASIAAYSMLMTDSQYKGTSSYDEVLRWLNLVNLRDEYGFKAQLRQLVHRSKTL